MQKYCIAWLVIAIAAFVILMIDMINVSKNQNTVFNSIADSIIHSTQNENFKTTITVIQIVLTSIYFVLALLPFIQGRCFALSCTCNSSERQTKIIVYIGIGFVLVTTLTFIITIIDQLGNTSALLFAILLHLIWATLTISLIYLTYLAALKC